MQKEGDLVGSNSHNIRDKFKQKMKETYGVKRTFMISYKLPNFRNRDLSEENLFLADKKKVLGDETIKNKRIAPAFQMMIQRNTLKSSSKANFFEKGKK